MLFIQRVFTFAVKDLTHELLKQVHRNVKSVVFLFLPIPLFVFD